MSDSAFRPTPDEEWENLMRQLHNQSKVSPRPYFYGRVNDRLCSSAAETHILPRWMLRPGYAMLLAAMMLTLSGDCYPLRPASEATRNAGDSVQLLRPVPR
jgi:hypothetical protein